MAILIIAVFVCANAPFSFAENQIDTQFITGNYFEFGEIVGVDVCGDSVYTLEIIDKNLYLRLLDLDKLIKLENTDEENFSQAQIIAFNNRVFVKQDDGIYVYLKGEDGVVKFVDLTYEYMIEDTALTGNFKSCGGASTDNVLVVDYNSILVFFDANADVDKTVKEKRISSTNTSSSNSFDKIVVENVEEGKIILHMYDSKIGNRFDKVCTRGQDGKYTFEREITQNAIDPFENVDLYTYFKGGVQLGADGLYNASERVIKISTEQDLSTDDDYIQLYSKITACGNKLYVVDNGQKAIKVFDEQFKLCELYGSIGNGVSDNANGLTRFRNPKYLCANDSNMALFDEGNARIVWLDLQGNILNTIEMQSVCGLCINDGLWFAYGDKLIKLDGDFEKEIELTVDGNILSVTTDQINVYVVTTEGLFVVDGFDLVKIECGDFVSCYGGKHDGVFYLLQSDSFAMFKDKKQIIQNQLTENEFFAVDYAGNVFCGSGDLLVMLTRNLNGFEKSIYKTNHALKEIVVTSLGKIFAISGDGLVEVKFDAVSCETIFENPSIEYPVKAIYIEKKSFGFVRPDNYESVVEVNAGSYIMFAKTSYDGNEFYFTELLRNGKYIDLYLPSSCGVLLEDGNIDNEYIKYGGADDKPFAYEYPSNSAEAVCEIEKGTSYKVVAVVADLWKWYELEIDGKRCYVNGLNYITAEPPFKTVERYYMRAKSDVLGAQVALYTEPSVESEVIAYVGEGTLLELTEPYNAESEFLQVRYEKGIAYIKTGNIQKDGLTEGQKFALGFAGAVIGLTIIFGLLSMWARRRKLEQ